MEASAAASPREGRHPGSAREVEKGNPKGARDRRRSERAEVESEIARGATAKQGAKAKPRPVPSRAPGIGLDPDLDPEAPRVVWDLSPTAPKGKVHPVIVKYAKAGLTGNAFRQEAINDWKEEDFVQNYNEAIEVHNKGGCKRALKDVIAVVFAHNSELNRFTPYFEEVARADRRVNKDTARRARIG